MIRYDPRDLAEVRVSHGGVFLCRAVCQELADQTISLKEIVRARNQRRRALKQEIKDRGDLVETYLQVHQEGATSFVPLPPPQVEPETPPARRLKLYENE